MRRTECSQSIVAGEAEGRILSTTEALSFWGGVSPEDGKVIDVHHPLHGACMAGAVLLMPSSRGSCTGSGVLLDLILNDRAPAALVFSGPEDVLTLGALVAAMMFDRPIPVVRVSEDVFQALSTCSRARIIPSHIEADGRTIPLAPPSTGALELTVEDRAKLSGEFGAGVQQAMQIICAMAAQQGAKRLIDVTQAHIDGCIYASHANLLFAQKIAGTGAQVRVPTTMNAISVDYANWRTQNVPEAFGEPAAKLAEAYVEMGCRPTYTCSPYLLSSAPSAGETIAWAESNAVIFANSVLGARTPKHPDFLDLCIALTGRAPLAGVYLDEHRGAELVIDVELPAQVDDAFWPTIGYLAGQRSPDRIPLLRGLASATPSRDDLKALCAAFGTTSAAPMLHMEGITPEAASSNASGLPRRTIVRTDMAEAWQQLSAGPEQVELVALGSPHASLAECRAFKAALAGRKRHADVWVIITAGHDVIASAAEDGTLAALQDAGVTVLPDLCWCSISEPVFPPDARTVLTNSGKYAHYGPGLSGRSVRLGSIAECAEAAASGCSPRRNPKWLV
ncbi:putative aconitase/putative aconitase with swiveling domain [Pseudorhizobium tarimense]|uniref:Aconitase/putative aconitase with swiveling domain n=1 Tax=Pseudorhizobium tarimense TaxID=1079109 RepID=A0ABV2H122_9HYPH|nr:aconitase family protein [Pseudorhizobium tarimense]MCJ8517481.1 aconitase family protein [Pseudorhizobium tarimense]